MKIYKTASPSLAFVMNSSGSLLYRVLYIHHVLNIFTCTSPTDRILYIHHVLNIFTYTSPTERVHNSNVPNLCSAVTRQIGPVGNRFFVVFFSPSTPMSRPLRFHSYQFTKHSYLTRFQIINIS
jgi:hypothetical protein